MSRAGERGATPTVDAHPDLPVRSALRGTLAVLVAAVLWGTTGTASQLAPPEAGPLAIGAARIVVGGMLLLAWAAARGQLRALGGRRHRRLLLVGAVAVAAYQLCFFAAVNLTGVAVGTVVAIGSGPVLTGLLTRLLHGTPLSGRWLLATVAAVAGCTTLVLGGTDAGIVPAGILLALLAGLSYAGYAVVASTLIVRGAPSTGVMGALFGGAAVLMLPVLLATGPGWLFQPGGALVAMHLAVVTTAVAYVLYGLGLRSVPVATAATLALAEPGAAALLGLLFLDEPTTATTLLGLLLLGAALVVVAVPARRGSRALVGG